MRSTSERGALSRLLTISGRGLVRAPDEAEFRAVRQKGCHARLEKGNEEVIKITALWTVL